MRTFPARHLTPDTPGMNKYMNKKVEVDGIIFDSQKESRHYLKLKAQKEAGEIASFDRQCSFLLIPKQSITITVTDAKGRQKQKEKVIEHACTYIADFVVEHLDGTKEVVDCKGARGLDAKYPIKRKLLLWRFGIRVQEV
jgi:hypothetical protein